MSGHTPAPDILSFGIAEFEKLSVERLRKQKAIQKERSERQLIREREIHREHKALAKTLPATKFHEELDNEETRKIKQRTADIDAHINPVNTQSSPRAQQ